MNIAMTGATGFLGLESAARLRARGHSLRALVRPTSRTAPLHALGVSTISVDLLDPTTLAPALADVEVLIHAAGGGYALRGPASLYRSNRDTTAALLEAAARSASLRRFILVSSIAAKGPSRSGAPESAPQGTGPQSHYGRAKAQAEALVRDAPADIEGLILRPPTIYGPGDTRLLPLLRAIDRGAAILPGPAAGASWVHVEDCAQALARMVAAPLPKGSAFDIADGPARPWPEVVRMLALHLGRAPRILRVPVPALQAAATLSELSGALRKRPVLFTRDKVQDMRQPWWVAEHTRIREALDWQPTISLEDGLRDLVQWYRSPERSSP